MYFMNWHAAVFLAAAALASVSVRRTGWLDRVVAYHKQNFYNDVQKIAPVQIKAKIEPAPKGYVDSPLWTFDSVMHLLVLISQSETAKPVRRALRRMMKPTRRYIPREKSLKLFPSIMKYYKNEFYYDVESSVEDYHDQSEGGVPEDDAVITVSNPVEARLPSARITVRLLRDILDARAAAARFMVTKPPSTFSWKPMNNTGIAAASGGDAAAGSGGDAAGGGDAAASSGGDAAGGGDAAAGGGDAAVGSGDAAAVGGAAGADAGAGDGPAAAANSADPEPEDTSINSTAESGDSIGGENATGTNDTSDITGNNTIPADEPSSDSTTSTD